MKKYFVLAFVASSTLLAAAPKAAFALTTDRQPASPAANDSSSWVGESGTASYYGTGYHGHRSASGLRYDQMALTAAHPWLPFGTKVRVTLAGTSRTVIVTITDRLYSPPPHRRSVGRRRPAARHDQPRHRHGDPAPGLIALRAMARARITRAGRDERWSRTAEDYS
jgi:rare lipoprotein A